MQKVSASPQTVHAKSVLQEGSVAACLPFLGHLHIRTFLHDNDKSLLHAWGTRIQSKGIMISPLVWSLVTLKIISEPQSALNDKTPRVGSKRAMKSCVGWSFLKDTQQAGRWVELPHTCQPTLLWCSQGLLPCSRLKSCRKSGRCVASPPDGTLCPGHPQVAQKVS